MTRLPRTATRRAAKWCVRSESAAASEPVTFGIPSGATDEDALSRASFTTIATTARTVIWRLSTWRVKREFAETMARLSDRFGQLVPHQKTLPTPGK